MEHPEDYYREKLTPEEYRVLREAGTEPPFSGDLLYSKEKGAYVCKACGNPVFSSETKFESGSGWPSFYDAIEGSVELRDDASMGMKRTEVVCAACGSHLGHMFDDGPAPTGKRYCINSCALQMEPNDEQ